MTIPDIGVQVEFYTMPLWETWTKYTTLLASGENLDLIMIPFTNFASYAYNGLILPMDDLLASQAPYLTEALKEFPVADGAIIDEEIYGIQPIKSYYGTQGGIVVRDDWFAETGLANEGLWSFDDYTALFAAIKANHPEAYPYGIKGTECGSSITAYGYFAELDNLGATTASGVLMGMDSNKIVNLYASEAFYKYLKYVESWYQAGYIMPDAATLYTTNAELIGNSIIASYPMMLQPDSIVNNFRDAGQGEVTLAATEPYYTSISASECTYWALPVTCDVPEAATRLLDYMYSNHTFANLLFNGIEGVHWEYVDESSFLIDYADGLDAKTSGYNVGLGLYGDRRYELVFSAVATPEVKEAFNQATLANQSVAVGYAYDTIDMADYILAVSGVLDQYLPALETGSVDVDKVYPEFLSALEAAGIDRVIADNQAKFDAWLAE